MNKAISHSVVLVVLFQTTIFTLSESTEDFTNVNIGIEDCGVNEGLGCLGFSNGCIETNDCEILATYQVQKSGDVTFTISGVVKTNQYLALAISEDASMGNDGVIVCFHHETKPRGILVSWNKPEKASIVLDKPFNYLLNRRAKFEDGMLWCKFTLRNTTKIPTPWDSEEPKVYELYRPYFLQLAKGRISKVGGKTELHRHNIRMTTDSKVDFAQTTAKPAVKKDLSGDDRKRVIKAHASLMVIAWMFFAEIGTFTAGYFRTRFPESSGVYWFHIHQFSMCTTWILSMISATLMFVSLGFGPLEAERLKNNPHAVIGLLGLIVTCFQPIMGFLRPDPYSNNRPLFNNIHKYLGLLATVLALTAIILASFLASSTFSEYIVIGPALFAIFYIGCHFFLHKVEMKSMTFCVRFGYFCGIGGVFLFLLAYLTVIIMS